jgi:uncharacterized protein (TIGR00251 family)
MPVHSDSVKAAADGIVISVRVTPRAGRAGLAGVRGGALLVRLHAPPVEGAANTELIDLLATALDVPRRNVSIVGGSRSRQKQVHVAGIDTATAVSLLFPVS